MKTEKPLAEVLLGGAAWMMAMRWGVRLIGLASTVILARLLMPEDFGMVAMAMVFVGLVTQLLDFGLEFGLLRNSHAERRHYDTTWTIRLLQMAGIAVLLVLASPLIASTYDEPRVIPILWVIGLGAFVRAWENIGTIDFRKHLLFDQDFKFNIYIKLWGFLVTIGLAFYLRSYWALVLGTLFNNCVAVALSYKMSSYRPRFSFEALHEVFGFSQWMLVRGLANYTFGRGDEFIVGKIFGSISLGYYAVAKNISHMATAEIMSPISRAFLPGFSKFEDDPTRLASAFVRAIAGISLLVVPVGLGLSCVASEVVPLVLGEKWSQATPFLQLLPVAEVIMAIHALAGSLVIVIGRVKMLAGVAWLRAMMMLCCVYVGYQWSGLLGVAYGMIVSSIFSFFALNSAAIHVSQVEWGNVLRALIRPLLSGLLMIAMVYEVHSVLVLPSLPLLIVKVVAGALTYLLGIFVLWRMFGGTQSIEMELMTMIRQKLKWN